MAESLFGNSQQNLRRRGIHGSVMTLLSIIIKKLLILVIIAVLSRQLSPADFGLAAMVLVVTAFLTLFSDMGFPLATIQKAQVDQRQISAMFWLNLLLGGLLTLLLCAAAPLVARFYHQPMLVPVTRWCSLTFFLTALGAQHGALLQRRMHFSALTLVETISTALGGTVGIIMALYGGGVYALVAQLLVEQFSASLLKWLFSRWLPGRPATLAEIHSMIQLGGYFTLYSVIMYFTRQLDRLLIGRGWGDTALGLYQRAYSLMLYPIDLVSLPLSRVGLPLLSKLQHQPERLRSAYVQMLHLIGFLTFPMMAILFVAVEDIIRILCGPNWMDAAPLFRILTIAGFWQGIYNATAIPFVVSGQTKRMFLSGIGLTAALTIAFFIGNAFGPAAVALAYVITINLVLLPYLKYTYATIGLPLRVVWRELRPALIASLVMTPLLWGINFYAVPTACWPPLRLFLCTCSGVVIYLLWLRLRHPVYTEKLLHQVRQYVRGFFKNDSEPIL